MSTFLNSALIKDVAGMFRAKAPPETTWIDENSVKIKGGVFFTTDEGSIVESVEYTKTITATWAAGNAGGMVAGGSIIAAQTLHLFAIYNPTTITVDYMFASTLTPTLPSGYIEKRRILSYRTLLADGKICKYTQQGDDIDYFAAQVDAQGTGTIGRQLITVSAPKDIITKAKMRLGQYGSNVGQKSWVIFNPAATEPGPGTAAASLSSGSSAAANYSAAEVVCFTNNVGQVASQINIATINLILLTYGYIDRRGRDD